MYFACNYVSVPYAYIVLEGRKRVLNPLYLELQVIRRQHMDTGNGTLLLIRGVKLIITELSL